MLYDITRTRFFVLRAGFGQAMRERNRLMYSVMVYHSALGPHVTTTKAHVLRETTNLPTVSASHHYDTHACIPSHDT